MQSLKFLCPCVTVSFDYQWGITPDLCFYRNPEEIKKEQAAAENGCNQGGISRWMDCFNSQVYSYSTWGCRLVWRYAGALCAIQQFSTDGRCAQPAAKTGLTALTTQAIEWVGTTTECSYVVLPQTLKQKRLTVNRKFLRNKNHPICGQLFGLTVPWILF